MLSTALLTFLMLCSSAACAVAVYFAAVARGYAEALAKQRGELVRLDGELSALDAIVKRLRGRVYADEQHGNRPRPPERDTEPVNSHAVDDAELASLLALQSAPPPQR